MRHLFALLAAVLLTACQGPATDCSPCDTEPVSKAMAPQGGGAAAASASGGQRANADPFSADYGAANPVIVTGRGEGDTASTSAYQADKTTSTGGTVNQAVVADSIAQAQASALGAKPASVVALEKMLANAMQDVSLFAPGTPEHAAAEKRVDALIDRIAVAEAAWQERLATLKPPSHDFSDAVITQSVLSGAGGSPVSPANAQAAAQGVPATVRAGVEARIAKAAALPQEKTSSVKEAGPAPPEPGPLPPAVEPPAGPAVPR